ncbi:Hypothetical protein A7982_05958 [Minicystis rosea]|nr:Hypothetical protein A7982_05958 [Minicystis rosea]
MKLRLLAPAAALAFTASVLPTTDARACGGCFHPPIISQGESTVVTGHRMAFSTSPTQTVLWDQIKYSGDPKDFAWVLPVRKGAVVQESTDAWFETLEATTTAQVKSPVIECPEITRPREMGCARAQTDAFSGGDEDPNATPPVQVIHQGTVGAYETVTLSTQTPGALNQWLTDHGYNVDADIQPIIDAYVAEGFDFIALRLQPGKGIREMKPVRVVMSGAALTLPLRMVAAGTGANVAITLFTITEGRLAADKFKNALVSPDELVWDFGSASSNYAEVRKSTLAKNSGLTWLTVLAQKGALLSPLPGSSSDDSGFGYDDYYGTPRTIASAYVDQAYDNGETGILTCKDELALIADSSALVVDPCPIGVAPDDPSCGQIAPGQIDARVLACGKVDDVKVALSGLHPRDVWVTRLEADLPRLALASDLTLVPAEAQNAVSNMLQAPKGINDDGLCPTSVPPLSMIAPGYGKSAVRGRIVSRTPLFSYAAMGLLAVGAVLRRTSRRGARK